MTTKTAELDPFAGIEQGSDDEQESKSKPAAPKKGRARQPAPESKAETRELMNFIKAADKQEAKAAKEVKAPIDKDKEEESKIKLIQQIKSFFSNETLNEHLKTQGISYQKSWEGLPLDKLQFRLKVIDEALNAKNNDNMADIVIQNGIRTIESIISAKTKYDIKGSWDQTMANKRNRFLLERLKMRYLSTPWITLSPEVELTLAYCQCALIQSQINSLGGAKPTTDLNAVIDLSALMTGGSAPAASVVSTPVIVPAETREPAQIDAIELKTESKRSHKKKA